MRPGEPITAGMPMGAGPGPEALGRPTTNGDWTTMEPHLPMLEFMAGQPRASRTFRMFVRRLRTNARGG